MNIIVKHCVGLAAGIAAWVCVGLAEEAANLPSVDDIIKRNVEALGGEKAMRKLKNRVARGKIELAVFGAVFPVIMRQTVPNKEMMELTLSLIHI